MVGFLIGAVIGAVTGGTIVARRGGNKKDIGQYAFGYAMCFGFLALFIVIFLARQGA